jgi:uncharacterized protein (DUF305 family)
MFRFLNRRLAAAASLVAGTAIALAGCAGGDAGPGGANATSAPPATAPSGSSAAASPAKAITGPHNDIDHAFARDMIPHHRQAVEMATLAETRAGDQRVKDLAARIKAAQDPEIIQMSGWLVTWGRPVPPPDMAHTAHGPGMMTHFDMESLAAASGRQFDRMFLDMMIRHHAGAIEMATAEQQQGENPTVKKVAAEIGTSQAAEVKEMRDLLARL